MNHIPVHAVAVFSKHLSETGIVRPAASTNMCQHFSYRTTPNLQNSFLSLRNKLLNIILGLLELFSGTGTNALTGNNVGKLKAQKKM